MLADWFERAGIRLSPALWFTLAGRSNWLPGFQLKLKGVSGQFSTSALEPLSSLHSWLARPAIARFNSRYPLAAILRGFEWVSNTKS